MTHYHKSTFQSPNRVPFHLSFKHTTLMLWNGILVESNSCFACILAAIRLFYQTDLSNEVCSICSSIFPIFANRLEILIPSSFHTGNTWYQVQGTNDSQHCCSCVKYFIFASRLPIIIIRSILSEASLNLVSIESMVAPLHSRSKHLSVLCFRHQTQFLESYQPLYFKSFLNVRSVFPSKISVILNSIVIPRHLSYTAQKCSPAMHTQCPINLLFHVFRNWKCSILSHYTSAHAQ